MKKAVRPWPKRSDVLIWANDGMRLPREMPAGIHAEAGLT
jgi:hypothetical protein